MVNIRKEQCFFMCFIMIVLLMIGYMTSKTYVSLKSDQVGEVLRSRTIPRLIHFIWNNESIPNEFAENVRGFIRNNPYPKWDYHYWTKKSALSFVKDKYPFLFARMSNSKVTSDMLRSDMLRYLIVYSYGGAYFDLDTVSVKPLDNYFDTHECSVAMEPREHYLLWNTDLLLTNAALVCVPGHPFFELIIWQLSQLSEKCTDAFGCTGPHFLTSLYRQVNRTSGTVSRLPDIQSPHVFQDAYDIPMLDRILQQNCFNKTDLPPHKLSICKIWKARGMKNRTLSQKALTYHTWFHTNIHPVTYSESNGLFKVLPHARLYGHNL